MQLSTKTLGNSKKSFPNQLFPISRQKFIIIAYKYKIAKFKNDLFDFFICPLTFDTQSKNHR